MIRNRRVNELVRDLELSARPEELVMQPWDRDAVHQLFDGLEFRVLRDRLFATLTVEEPQAESGFDLSGSVLRPGEVAGWLAAATRNGWLAADAVVVVERAARAGAFPWPEPLHPVRERRYGDTVLHVAAHDPAG